VQQNNQSGVDARYCGAKPITRIGASEPVSLEASWALTDARLRFGVDMRFGRDGLVQIGQRWPTHQQVAQAEEVGQDAPKHRVRVDGSAAQQCQQHIPEYRSKAKAELQQGSPRSCRGGCKRRGGGSDGMDPSQSSTRSRISPMKYVGTLPATKSEAYYPGANP
jgi:hypothetical protein